MSAQDPPPIAPLDGEILRALVGSTLHGTGLDGAEDRDEMGVLVEAPRYVTGLDRFEQHQFRTKPEGERSGPGDLDLTVYGARKYLRLATQGNPSILLLLFVPHEYLVVRTILGDSLQALAPAIVSRQQLPRFLGYMKAQRERLLGLRGGKHTNRPELIEQFGFDTKYAMHMVRLGFQGVELMHSGRITLPMPEAERVLCGEIRRGERSKETAVGVAEALEDELEGLYKEADLPEQPDLDAVNRWLHGAYLESWYS